MLQWWRWHGPYFCASGAASIFNLLRRHACSWDYSETLWSLAETTQSTFVQTPFHLFMPRRWYSCSWFPLQSNRTQPLGQWGFSKKDILLENLRPPWTTFWMEWWNAEFLCLHPMQTLSTSRPWRTWKYSVGSSSVHHAWFNPVPGFLPWWLNSSNLCWDIVHRHPGRCTVTAASSLLGPKKMIQSYKSKQIPQSSWIKRYDWHFGKQRNEMICPAMKQ